MYLILGLHLSLSFLNLYMTVYVMTYGPNRVMCQALLLDLVPADETRYLLGLGGPRIRLNIIRLIRIHIAPIKPFHISAAYHLSITKVVFKKNLLLKVCVVWLKMNQVVAIHYSGDNSNFSEIYVVFLHRRMTNVYFFFNKNHFSRGVVLRINILGRHRLPRWVIWFSRNIAAHTERQFIWN